MTEIHLSDNDRDFIEEPLTAGIYRNADEVVAAGLRPLGSKEGSVEQLRHLIQQGIDDVDAGRVMEFETAEDLTAHILKMAKDQKSAEASAQNVDRGSERSSRRL